MSFLHRNVAVILVALLVCVPPWLFGGMRSSSLLPVMPWLVAFALEAVFFFPQRRGDETSYQARDRVWEALRHDPLVWIALALIALLTIPFANVTPCAHCGAEVGEEVLMLLPTCLNRMHHLGVMLWIVPAMVAMVAVKHGLSKDGKLLLLEMAVWNGVALVALGLLQQATDAQGPLWHSMGPRKVYFFSTFGYPNMGGDYFTTLFLLAAGLWRHRADESRERERLMRSGSGETRVGGSHSHFWCRHYLLIAMGVLFFGAMDTLSRASILIASAGAVVVFVHSCLCSLIRLRKKARVKVGALWTLVLVVIGLAVVLFMPRDVGSELGTLETHSMLNRVTGKGQRHMDTALAIWRDYPVFGSGGWGFLHLNQTYATKLGHPWTAPYPDTGGVNVHNDYLQVLCEHGLVGSGLLVTLAVLLLVPLFRAWARLAKSARFLANANMLPPPKALFALPAGAFFTLLAAVGTLVHAFADCPLRSAAVFILFYTLMAAVDGYLPYVPNESEKD